MSYNETSLSIFPKELTDDFSLLVRSCFFEAETKRQNSWNELRSISGKCVGENVQDSAEN